MPPIEAMEAEERWGICGKDGNLLRGKVKDKELGWVGEIESVDPKLLNNLIDGGFIPVVATVAQDAKGNALNVNADTAAGAIAAALNAKKVGIDDGCCWCVYG